MNNFNNVYCRSNCECKFRLLNNLSFHIFQYFVCTCFHRVFHWVQCQLMSLGHSLDIGKSFVLYVICLRRINFTRHNDLSIASWDLYNFVLLLLSTKTKFMITKHLHSSSNQKTILWVTNKHTLCQLMFSFYERPERSSIANKSGEYSS